MLLPLRASAFVALAVSTASLAHVVESRLILPTSLELQAFKLRRDRASADDLPARIQSYFAGSGFPKAGRSRQQKIDDADAFLTAELPKTGAVGVSTAIVYQDQVVYVKGYGLRRYNDAESTVSKHDMFQIGSVSKTFIALGVGLLVDNGSMQWTDPVKKHLPWLQLFDKYAEAHARVGDLLAMNSGLGRSQDPAIFVGGYPSARSLIEGLAFAEPDFSLRETPAYANTNYEILGQLIAEVSGQPWAEFLRDRIWKPLNMTHTFASVEDIPSDLQQTALNAGHHVCDKSVVGPFEMLHNPATNISPGYKHLAAGSIVSSAVDMAKLLRLILNKGTVDGVQLFQSRATIAEMITGKSKSFNELFAGDGALLPQLGYEFLPDGNSLSAGYGFDIIGPVLWGHAYVDKGGDTFVHHTTTGYAPHDGLGLVLLSNSEGSIATVSDQLRSYVMGIFLDVPKEILDFQFAKWQADAPPKQAPFPGAPVCGFEYWEEPPRPTLPTGERDAFIGEYKATNSAAYFPPMTITRAAVDNQLIARVGRINATLSYVGDMNSTRYFLVTNAPVGGGPITAVPDLEQRGTFIVFVLGQGYRKQ